MTYQDNMTEEEAKKHLRKIGIEVKGNKIFQSFQDGSLPTIYELGWVKWRGSEAKAKGHDERSFNPITGKTMDAVLTLIALSNKKIE